VVRRVWHFSGVGQPNDQAFCCRAITQNVLVLTDRLSNVISMFSIIQRGAQG
jgi:hypothetical protein